MNDPRQDSVAGRLGHLELQRPALVDRPGEYVVAWRLVDGGCFRLSPGLVNGALSFGHPAIERETFTGFDLRDGAYGHGLGFDGGPGTVDLAHLDLWRRQLQQTSDRVSRALDRPGLDKFGQRIERHDHRRLGPLANGKGARNGHTHQGVDVELAPKQRDKPLRNTDRPDSAMATAATTMPSPRHGRVSGARKWTSSAPTATASAAISRISSVR